MIKTPLGNGPGSITISVPQVHWATTTITIVVCVVLLVIMWAYGAKWSHRVHIFLSVLIGMALILTNAGAWALAHIHNWTGGLFG